MKWDWYYKVGQVILESRAVLRYYKVGKVIHYKVEQSLLQSGTNFLPDEYESGVEQYNKWTSEASNLFKRYIFLLGFAQYTMYSRL